MLRLYLVAHTLEMLALIRGMRSDAEYVNLQPLMWQLQQVHNLSALNPNPDPDPNPNPR